MVLFRSALSRGDGVHDHDAATLLQVANTLDRESLPSRGAVLVPRAEQFDCGSKLRIAVVGKHLDLDTIDCGQIDGDRKDRGRRHPGLRPRRTARRHRCPLVPHRGHIDLDGTVAINRGGRRNSPWARHPG